MGRLVGFVVKWWMMLGTVVDPVDPPGGTIKMELILGGSATQPVKLHVHRFVMKRQDCVVSDAVSSGVISLKGIRWLRTTHFKECLEYGNHFLCSDKHGGKFVFSGRRHDKLDNLSDGKNGDIVTEHRFIFR